MNILILKEIKSRKPDLMTYAVTEAFSNCDDVVNIASIKVKSIQKTVTAIKGLIKLYKPDIVVAQKMLASIVLFNLPKSCKKIIIDPYLLFDDREDDTKLALIFKYGSIRLNNWLYSETTKFIANPDKTLIKNWYCIVRNFMNNFSRYDQLVSVFTTAGYKNIFLEHEESTDFVQRISSYHQIINKAHHYFDPNYELPNIEELIKK